MKKLFIFTILLLITSQTFASDYVARKDGYGSCLIKLSDNLKCEKKYDFYADKSTIFDDDENFIGLKRVEDALKNAGITDYKIERKAKGELLYFNIITTNEKKDFLPLIMAKSGVFVNTSEEKCNKDEILEKVFNTKAYTSCYNKAYNMAIEDLKSLGRPDALSVDGECIYPDEDITLVDNETVRVDVSVSDECSWTEDKSKDSK